MVFLWITVAVVGPLLVWAAVTDLRARRRGVRYRGVDAGAGREARRAADTENHMRTHGQGGWGGTGPF
jgi:hypothetical protein